MDSLELQIQDLKHQKELLELKLEFAISKVEFLEALKDDLLSDMEWEYGWAGDSQATTFYNTREEAEEYMGNPKRFQRRKAGPWKAVEE